MSASPPSRHPAAPGLRQQWPLLLVAAGAALLAAALTGEALWGGTRGFGRAQQLASAAGAVLLGCGLLGAVQPFRRWRGLAPDPSAAAVGRFAAVALEVSLLTLVLQLFRVESPAFHERILPLALCGFLLHHLLPLRFRLPWFVLFSLGGVLAVFGWPAGGWLVGLGVLIIGLCHLPVAFAIRVALVVLAGTALAVARAGGYPVPWSPGIWPILGSMFMFRTILYLYDLRHATEASSPWRTLAYFFLLPNVTFPLFPVVDFATFRRTWYDQEATAIYQRGVRWMLLGTGHLLMYRFVYQHLVLPPEDVASAGDFARHVVANFGLYLRVAGQFHLIVGMLHLFGFRLPETHKFFFLASSFTDFWRRINIYWKDFMVKVFQYPVYFRLRRRGETSALVIGTLVVFLATWALHSYQWFWILGEVLLTWPDTLFWGLLAGLLVANVLYEVRHPRRRTLRTPTRTTRERAAEGLASAVTFTAIALLWSLWTSPTMADWFALWSGAGTGPGDWAAAIALVFGAALLLVTALRLFAWAGAAVSPRLEAGGWSSSAVVVPVLLGMYLTGRPEVAARLPGLAGGTLRDLTVANLNRADAARRQEGYYEKLAVDPLNSQLWGLTESAEPRFPAWYDTDAARLTGDFRYGELLPLVRTNFRGAPFSTNRWGMRDQDYPVRRPPDVRRIAILGASYTMGWGVDDGESFEALVEERLNQEGGGGASPSPIELLNFASPDYWPLQQVAILQSRVFPFEPEAVVLIANPRDPSGNITHLVRAVRNGVEIPFAEVRDIVRRAGVDSSMPEPVVRQRLRVFRDELAAWAYRQIAQRCRARGVLPVWVMIPLPGEDPTPSQMLAVATAAGFEAYDLSQVYDGLDTDSLDLPGSDTHPNAAGHRVIADRIYPVLRDVLEKLTAGTGQ